MVKLVQYFYFLLGFPMKISAMLFGCLIVNIPFYASNQSFFEERKIIINAGLEGKKSGLAILLYSSSDLLKQRNVAVTDEERQRELLLEEACQSDFEDYKLNLSTSPDYPRIEEIKKFKQQLSEKRQANKQLSVQVLQQRHDTIKEERQRLKEIKIDRLQEKQEGYKEFISHQQRVGITEDVRKKRKDMLALIHEFKDQYEYMKKLREYEYIQERNEQIKNFQSKVEISSKVITRALIAYDISNGSHDHWFDAAVKIPKK